MNLGASSIVLDVKTSKFLVSSSQNCELCIHLQLLLALSFVVLAQLWLLVMGQLSHCHGEQHSRHEDNTNLFWLLSLRPITRALSGSPSSGLRQSCGFTGPSGSVGSSMWKLECIRIRSSLRGNPSSQITTGALARFGLTCATLCRGLAGRRRPIRASWHT